MITFEKLTHEQIGIVKHICSLQLDSLKRITDKTILDQEKLITLLEENDVTDEEFQAALETKLVNFENLHKNPEELSQLNDNDLSMFRHILTNVEEKYVKKYPRAISNLWERLYIIERLKSVETN